MFVNSLCYLFGLLVWVILIVWVLSESDWVCSLVIGVKFLFLVLLLSFRIRLWFVVIFMWGYFFGL